MSFCSYKLHFKNAILYWYGISLNFLGLFDGSRRGCKHGAVILIHISYVYALQIALPSKNNSFFTIHKALIVRGGGGGGGGGGDHISVYFFHKHVTLTQVSCYLLLEQK